jgi:hypothetical protein
MPSTISTFINSLTNDIAKPNRFDVEIAIPQTLLSIIPPTFGRTLNLRCESAQLPSRTIGTTPQKFGSNPVEMHPYVSAFGGTTLNFIASGNMAEKAFFDAWLELIHPTTTFDFQYRDTYITSVIVNQYSNENKLAYSIELIDAFPVSIEQMDLNWQTEGHLSLSVQFEYRYWRQRNIKTLSNSALLAPKTPNAPTNPSEQKVTDSNGNQYSLSEIAAG